MNADLLSDTLGRLRAHGEINARELFESAPATIAAAARIVLNPASTHHKAFLDAAPAVGFSTQMVREALSNLLQSLTYDALEQHVGKSIGQNPAPRSPQLIFHVLAGNLFVSGIESINTAMLAGSLSIVRCSANDQVFPALWRQALAEVSSLWGDAIHVTHWSKEEAALTALACEHSDVVIAFGADESVAAIRALTPPRAHFVPHGTKVSFALISAAALEENSVAVARALAYDISIYDQQGCLSPRAIFIELPRAPALECFRQAFLSEMRQLQSQLPPGPNDLAETAALARERSAALIEAALSEDTQVWSRATDQFVATVRPALPYKLGSLNRFADLRLYTRPKDIENALAPFRETTSTLGITGSEGAWTRMATTLRADRLCPIGQMQKPPFGWTHDGRQPLSELLRISGPDAKPWSQQYLETPN